MLGKGKSTTPTGSPPPRERDDFEPILTPTPVSTGGKTVIGEKIAIEGGIRGGEDLVIEGSVKGSIELEKHHLTVGPKGQVEGEIHADNVTISGRLTGNIEALGKVEITQEADFNGEIKAKRISVEDGAYLKAVIELEREGQPKSGSVAKMPEKAPEKPAPAAAPTSPSAKEPGKFAKEAEKGK
jgi:cytoskeletal protein CcmA (bactofilin family)